jgi:hypothetical protein
MGRAVFEEEEEERAAPPPGHIQVDEPAQQVDSVQEWQRAIAAAGDTDEDAGADDQPRQSLTDSEGQDESYKRLSDEASPAPRRAHEHRVDWTQSDETRTSSRDLFNPLLRRAESILYLKRRIAKGLSLELDDSKACSLPEGPKSPRENFFARFRR